MSATRWGVLLVTLVAAIVGGWWWWTNRAPEDLKALIEPPAEVAAAPLPPPAAPTPPDYPVPEPAADAPPLPALADSDGPFAEALTALGGDALGRLLVPDALIRRIVVTIDNLARPRAAPKLLPISPTPGAPAVQPVAEGYLLELGNAARYTAARDLFLALDPDALVGLYRRWYPRFEQAYHDLGYPDQRFNNRLIAVLDHLIATPPITEPILLVKPKVYYEYADAERERASAGRKLLWRIGRANREPVVARLRLLRETLIAAGKPAEPVSAAASDAAAPPPPSVSPTSPDPDAAAAPAAPATD